MCVCLSVLLEVELGVSYVLGKQFNIELYILSTC